MAGSIAAGVSLEAFRREVRSNFFRLTADYRDAFSEPSWHAPGENTPLFVTGHQPELYHLGVWAKSFAVHEAAARVGGVGVHVMTDNDDARPPVLRLPTGDPRHPLIMALPFDGPAPPIPHEERAVVDETLFAQASDQVAKALRAFRFEPLMPEMWDTAVRAKRITLNRGERLGAGRRAIERSLGCTNLELPLSKLCDTDTFLLVVARLACDAEQFVHVHNTALAAYRKRNRIRSAFHPVPALEGHDGWHELPFWVWSRSQPVRRRCFVRAEQGRLSLRAGDEVIVASVAARAGDEREMVPRLRVALGEWKIRPRALITTLYLRLGLADYFVHGVGGGKYDELTDAIIAGYFGLEPPPYAILTATRLLPIAAGSVRDADLAAHRRLERDLYWNPERHLDDRLREQSPVAMWIEQKYDRIAERPETADAKRARFAELRRLGDLLRPFVLDRMRKLEAERLRLTEMVESARLLTSREYAFCLHPRETAMALLEQIRGQWPAGTVS